MTMKLNHKTSSLSVGITGGIGSGKTAAAKIFGSLGAKVLFADELATRLIDTRREIRNRIKRALGEHALRPDGSLDRKAVARMVFNDDRLLTKLDEIVHPEVLEAMQDEISRFSRSGRGGIIMIEAALLYEAHAEGMFDYVIVVDAPERDRIARIMSRDHVSRGEVLQRMKSQLPAAGKVAKADLVVRNSGDLRTLDENCRFVFRILTGLTRGTLAPSG
jgi:dephospho-CoA kinase